ncbi:hypothetical protein AX15_006372 [Amanita polypyramis BW_CC]|nr:hypothetical protein AX15_006372 [Amanita polypyramis BW_CC]
MSSNPNEIGTLIVVVLKANHLPNKRHIGKQDPYCVVTVNGEKRRTKAIKRGGQHPEWDEEIRFTLLEDKEDTSDQMTQRGDSPLHPPPKSSRGPKKIKGGRTMKVACFADDSREPDFIGEADVDLTEVLTKGETDEWFTLTNKDKFAGKVYLELTFWSNEPAPEKKVSKPQKTNKYAGPGYFNPLEDHLAFGHGISQSRISNVHEQSRPSDSVSSTPRVPNPKTQSELLYDPPYLQKYRVSPLDRVSNDFGELDVSDRRTPSQNSHFLSSSVSSGYSVAQPQPTHSFDFPSSEQTYVQSYEGSITSLVSTQSQQSASVPNSLQPGYNSTQDSALTNGYQQSSRRSRIPTSSSGFMPLHGPSSLISHPSDPTGLASYNPTPAIHNTHYPTQAYTSVLSQAPAPGATAPHYVQTQTPSSFTPQSYQPSQSVQYSHYTPVMGIPTPAVPSSTGSYINTQAQVPVSQQAQPVSSHHTPYVSGNTPPSTHDQLVSPLHVQASSHIISPGSRPLPPQPQTAFNQSQIQSPYTAPQVMPTHQTVQQSNITYQSQVPFPPIQPPPPPPINYNSQAYSPDGQPGPGLPPPPPTPTSDPEQTKARARRRSSLPRPPINYVQSDRPPPPPPPPLPTNGYLQGQLPPSQGSNGQVPFSHPGPPPKPPVMVDGQSQWLPSHNSLSAQNGYAYTV